MVNRLKAKNALDETPEISALDHTEFSAVVHPLGMLTTLNWDEKRNKLGR